jgi:hypothetical protein
MAERRLVHDSDDIDLVASDSREPAMTEVLPEIWTSQVRA